MLKVHKYNFIRKSFMFHSILIHIAIIICVFVFFSKDDSVINNIQSQSKDIMYINAKIVSIPVSSGEKDKASIKKLKENLIKKDLTHAKSRLKQAKIALKNHTETKSIINNPDLNSKVLNKVKSRSNELKEKSKLKLKTAHHKVEQSHYKKNNKDKNFDEIANKLKKLGVQGLNDSVMDKKVGTTAKQNSLISQGLLTKYLSLMKSKIEKNWSNPFAGNLNAKVLLILSTSGAVEVVKVIESSGNMEYDQQLVLAVKKSSPLPFPNDKYLKHSMKEITLNFSS